ncbi:hypothetical protein TeGR_g13449, partial [Tetraparma gracilis]
GGGGGGELSEKDVRALLYEFRTDEDADPDVVAGLEEMERAFSRKREKRREGKAAAEERAEEEGAMEDGLELSDEDLRDIILDLKDHPRDAAVLAKAEASQFALLEFHAERLKIGPVLSEEAREQYADVSGFDWESGGDGNEVMEGGELELDEPPFVNFLRVARDEGDGYLRALRDDNPDVWAHLVEDGLELAVDLNDLVGASAEDFDKVLEVVGMEGGEGEEDDDEEEEGEELTEEEKRAIEKMVSEGVVEGEGAPAAAEEEKEAEWWEEGGGDELEDDTMYTPTGMVHSPKSIFEELLKEACYDSLQKELPYQCTYSCETDEARKTVNFQITTMTKSQKKIVDSAIRGAIAKKVRDGVGKVGGGGWRVGEVGSTVKRKHGA